MVLKLIQPVAGPFRIPSPCLMARAGGCAFDFGKIEICSFALVFSTGIKKLGLPHS